jgi:hypothetical protein
MPRPTGIRKRQPELSPEVRGRYARISKADWADLYADLYRQVFGESETDEAVLQDAEKRLGILKTYRGNALCS